MIRQHCVARAGENQFAAVFARAGAEIEHVIGGQDRVRIVLHHQQRVAQIAQALQNFNQAVRVARMQADGRLIQHVQRAHQMRAQRRGQLDALRFAAGKRGGQPVERQIIEAHFVEETQALLDFFQNFFGDRGFARRSAASVLKNGRASFTVIWQTSVIERPAILTARASARRRVPWQSGQVA